jgi:hypothetical protein
MSRATISSRTAEASPGSGARTFMRARLRTDGRRRARYAAGAARGAVSVRVIRTDVSSSAVGPPR